MKRPLSNADFETIKEVYHSGGQDIEVCKALGITLREFNNYYDTKPDFAEFIDMGRLYMKAWWINQGRINLENKKFNQSLWAFQMKNLFGWSEKAETVNIDTGEPKTLAEADKMLEKLYPGLLKSLKSDIEVIEVEAVGNH